MDMVWLYNIEKQTESIRIIYSKPEWSGEYKRCLEKCKHIENSPAFYVLCDLLSLNLQQISKEICAFKSLHRKINESDVIIYLFKLNPLLADTYTASSIMHIFKSEKKPEVKIEELFDRRFGAIQYYCQKIIEDGSFLNLNSLTIFSSSVLASQLSIGHPIYLDEQGAEVFMSLNDKYKIFDFIDSLGQTNTLPFNIWSSGRHSYYPNIIVVMLYIIMHEGYRLKKCAHCGKYFVSIKKSDEKYCVRSSPKYPHLNCKDAAKYIRQLEREHANESNKAYKSIYNMKYAKVKSAKNDILRESYENDLQNFMAEAAKWKNRVKSGSIAEDEYIMWLNTFKKRGKKYGNDHETR